MDGASGEEGGHWAEYGILSSPVGRSMSVVPHLSARAAEPHGKAAATEEEKRNGSGLAEERPGACPRRGA
jgi:hypothetical protein